MRENSKEKAEMMLMGLVTPVESREEAQEMTDYILNVVRKGRSEDEQDTAEDVMKGVSTDCEIKHMVVNTLEDMVLITYLLDDGEEEYPEDLATRDGVFSYVYNVNISYFSELGYTFYNKVGDHYKRIG